MSRLAVLPNPLCRQSCQRTKVKFREVQSRVPPREAAEVEQKIPRLILQTFRDNLVGPKVARNIRNLLETNPCYEYRLYTDEEAAELLRGSFPRAVSEALESLRSGAAKGDLIRYCLLYKIGGVYLDLDSTFGKALDELVEPQVSCYIGLEPDRASPVQWAMMFACGHPLLKELIKECVKRVLLRSHGHIFDATGPNLYSDVLIKYLSGLDLSRTKNTEEQRRLIVSGGMEGTEFVPTQGDHPWKYTFRGYSRDQLYTTRDQRYNSNEKFTYRLYHTDAPHSAAVELLEELMHW